MANNYYYRLDNEHNAIPCKLEEAEFGMNKCGVSKTIIKTRLERFVNFITFGKFSIKGERIRISTVFLGIDHNYLGKGEPILFETMVFGGKYDQQQERYSRWEQAEAGHKRWVKKVMERIV